MSFINEVKEAVRLTKAGGQCVHNWRSHLAGGNAGYQIMAARARRTEIFGSCLNTSLAEYKF